MTAVSIPPYDLNLSSANTFEMSGVVEASNSQGRYYQRRREPRLMNTITLTVDPSEISNIVSGNNSSGTKRTFAILKSGSPLEYNLTAGVHSFGVVGGFPANIKLKYFEFQGILHFIGSDNNIYAMSGDPNSDAVAVTSNLQSQISDLGIVSEVTDVGVWQNRVWLAYDNILLWCDTDNVGEWRPEYTNSDTGALVNTNAGNQPFSGSSEITGIGVHGDYFYVFLDNEVFRSQVLDVDVQFGFTPLSLDLDYVGGGVSTRSGFYFFASAGLYKLNGDALAKVSEPINPRLTGLKSLGTISSTVVVDDVFWTFSEGSLSVVFNVIYGTINAIYDNQMDVFGTLSTDVHTIGELEGTIGDLVGTIADLSPDSDVIPIGLKRASATEVGVYGFGFLDKSFVRFNFRKDLGNRRTIVEEISSPEQNEWSIRIKEGETLNWGDNIMADRFGTGRVYSPFVSPDIEVSVSDEDTLRAIDIKFSDGDR